MDICGYWYHVRGDLLSRDGQVRGLSNPLKQEDHADMLAVSGLRLVVNMFGHTTSHPKNGLVQLWVTRRIS